MGHEVEFVDYKVEPPILKSSVDKKKYIKQKLKNHIIDFCVNYKSFNFLLPKDNRITIENYILYNEKFLPMLGVSKGRNYNPKVDVLLIGSDEVFNCLQINPRVGYSRELFGLNNNAKKLISYAASFGNTTLEKLYEYKIDVEISNLLSQFDYISVRDDNSRKIVTVLTRKEPSYNVDPVLIYDFTKEIPRISIKSDYIVIYAYAGRLSTEEKTVIQNFAKRKKKRLVCLGGYQDFCDEYIKVSPFELLAYIKHADYVITDTFHGTIYSIINHKPFVSFIRRSQNGLYGNEEKITDLLHRFHLDDRGIYEPNELEKIIDKPINYDEVEKIRRNEIQKAIIYLENSIH